jgi:hypothetical protein
MPRRIAPLALPLLLAALGCLPLDSATTLVPVNPFSTEPAAPPQPAQVNYAPANGEAATRVGLVGQKVVAANPQTGVRPLFRTVSAPQAEVFHRGTTEVIITEGLVKQCTEGQLAAVLAVELGKMVSEREAQAAAQDQVPDRDPPPALDIGGDAFSTRGAADQTRLAELAKFERQKRAAAGRPMAPPDPQALAHGFLLKAGYSAADLQAAESVLKAAAQNMTLERQFTPSAAANQSWVR